MSGMSQKNIETEKKDAMRRKSAGERQREKESEVVREGWRYRERMKDIKK